MSEQNEKLTAVEMWQQSHQFAHLTQDRNIPSELLSDVHFVMEDFAAQQVEHATAELRKEFDDFKKEYYAIDENGDPVGYAFWKDESFKMQDFATKYMKERDELRKELERLKGGEEMTEEEQASLDRVANNYHSERIGIHKDRYDIEIHKAFQEGAKWAVKFRASWQPVTKGAIAAVSKLTEQIESLKTQLAEAQRQRDEAVELLKEWQEYGEAGAVEWICGDTIYEDTADLISRLTEAKQSLSSK